MMWIIKGPNTDPGGTPYSLLVDLGSTNQIKQRSHPPISCPHCWDTVKTACFYLWNTSDFWTAESGSANYLARRLIAACTWWQTLYAVCICRIKYSNSYSGSKFSLSSRAGDTVIFACFVHNPLHVLAQPECKLSFPRVPKHWRIPPPLFLLQNAPISGAHREPNVK